MNSYWCTCIDDSGCKWIKKGERYLVRFWGKNAYVIRDAKNSHRRYSNPLLARRFKTIKLTTTFKPLMS